MSLYKRRRMGDPLDNENNNNDTYSTSTPLPPSTTQKRDKRLVELLLHHLTNWPRDIVLLLGSYVGRQPCMIIMNAYSGGSDYWLTISVPDADNYIPIESLPHQIHHIELPPNSGLRKWTSTEVVAKPWAPPSVAVRTIVSTFASEPATHVPVPTTVRQYPHVYPHVVDTYHMCV
jgi:hypothetical protein